MLTSPSTRRRGETTRTVEIGTREMTVAIGIAGPARAAGERQRQPARTARERLRRDEHARGVASFDDALHAQPRRERDPCERGGRHIGKIEHDAREPAGLEHEVERFQRAIDQTVWPGSRLRSSSFVGRGSRSPRTQSSRSRSIPAAAADATSRRSNVSTNAAISPRRVDAAIICSTSVVRPDECGPTISESWPRGTPPRRQASSAATSVAITADASRRSSGGSAVVSVRSSFRAAKRRFQASERCIRHMFASRRKYSETLSPRVKPRNMNGTS